jgi:hypothetical protein
MSLTLIALTILLSSLFAGFLAYAVITISELKKNKKMWEQAYTELAIEFMVLKAGK